MLQDILQIAEYISPRLKETGICDPMSGKISPNHWGNAFYSLLCGQLYQETQENLWLEKLEISLKAELLSYKNRFKDKDIYRWEFKNYALLKLYPLLIDIPDDMKNKVKERILSMQHVESFQTNWIAMRALNYLLRYSLFGQKPDKILAEKELSQVLLRQNQDGLFWDYYNQNSFQYHAYILALLIQYYEISPSIKLKEQIQKGVSFLVTVTDNQGDFNYYGRGQKQTFGYVAGIFTLSKWSKITGERKYKSYAKLIYNYIIPYIRGNKILANNDEDVLAGYYRYNFPTEYLVFSGVYLYLCNLSIEETDLPEKEDLEVFFRESNIFVKKTKEYSTCITGNNYHSSEIGCLVSIYPRSIYCSGGPPINIDGPQEDYTDNYLGVVDSGNNPLSGLRGKLSKVGNKITISYNLENYDLDQIFTLDKDVKLEVKVRPKKSVKLKPLHYVGEKLESSLVIMDRGDLITPEGIGRVFESEEFVIDKEATFSLVLFKGEKEPISSIEFSSSEVKELSKLGFKAGEYLHFSKVMGKKLITSPKDFFLMFGYNKVRGNYKK